MTMTEVWMPGVRQLPIDRSGRPMVGPRLVLLHTNAAGPVSVDQFYASMKRQLAAGNTETTIPHFQVAIDGDFAQFVPLDKYGVTCYRANSYTVGIETADHGGNVTAEPWTLPQVASLVRILAWVSSVTGIPLARPSSWQTTGVEGHCASQTLRDGRGFNYPNTSNASGKICPGVARIAQIDNLLLAANLSLAPATPTPPTPTPTTEDDMRSMDKVVYTKHQGKGEWIYSVATGLRYCGSPSFVASLLFEDQSNLVYWDDAQMDDCFAAYAETTDANRARYASL